MTSQGPEESEAAGQPELQPGPHGDSRETYFRALFNSASDAILVADSQGVYIDANVAAGALLGYETSQLIGMNVNDIVAASPTWTENEYRIFMETGRWRGEIEVRRQNGDVIPVEAAATTVDLASGQVGISALRDISERKRLQRLQQDFLAMVGHELRNPLTPIIGYSQILLRQKQYDEEALLDILNSARRLQRLVDDLVDSARFQSVRFELEPSKFDLVELSQSVIESLRSLSDKHEVSFDGTIAPITGVWDKGRLQQILDNLLSNAIKYSPQGGDIVLQLLPTDDVVEIVVSDCGIGLTTEQAASIFDPFFRASTGMSTAGGLGLGLYIVRLLVEAHGGQVRVTSEGPMKGSEFRVTLPRSL